MSEHLPLSPRKEAILRALVQEYIRSGEPVASRQLADQLAELGPGYASATVRNELVALEEEGLIYQPHVSAGRVPTDLGYRYFVERLMGESRLAVEEQRLISHQFYQVQHQLDEWVRLTASVLAQALHSTAVITPPRASEARLKHFELLSLYEAVVLLVLVLDDGTVRQERIILNAPRTQGDLSRLARRFNEGFAGATAEQVLQATANATAEAGAAGALDSDEQLVLDSLARVLAQAETITAETVFYEGLPELLRHQDFAYADAERVRKVVEALRENRVLPAIAPQVLADDGVQVIIGGEQESDALHDMSLVVARYGGKGPLGGLLGVVGPTRMQYGRAVAVVRYMTQLLNELLAETYNAEDASP